jgi:hypothetical protein
MKEGKFQLVMQFRLQSDENEGKLVASGSMVFTVFLLV